MPLPLQRAASLGEKYMRPITTEFLFHVGTLVVEENECLALVF